MVVKQLWNWLSAHESVENPESANDSVLMIYIAHGVAAVVNMLIPCLLFFSAM